MEELIQEYKEWKEGSGSGMQISFDENDFFEWLKTRDISKIVDAFEWMEESYDKAEEYNGYDD